jgi:hypothetical protein
MRTPFGYPITDERGAHPDISFSVQRRIETHSQLSDAIYLRDCRTVLDSGVGDIRF